MNPVSAPAQPSPEHILQVGFGFWASKTLLSAIELGVFTELAMHPLPLSELQGRLGLHSRSARDFFDALLAFFLPAPAAFRPSFSLDFCSWNATHIVLAEITPRDDEFHVLESWKGRRSRRVNQSLFSGLPHLPLTQFSLQIPDKLLRTFQCHFPDSFSERLHSDSWTLLAQLNICCSWP